MIRYNINGKSIETDEKLTWEQVKAEYVRRYGKPVAKPANPVVKPVVATPKPKLPNPVEVRKPDKSKKSNESESMNFSGEKY